jgi:hypothetical protein
MRLGCNRLAVSDQGNGRTGGQPRSKLSSVHRILHPCDPSLL